MKLLIYIVFLFLVTACGTRDNQSAAQKQTEQEQHSSFTLSGKVSPLPESPTKLSVYFSEKDSSVLIQEDSVFSVSIPITKAEYVRFQILNEYGTIYAEPGDSVFFEANMDTFYETLSFTGNKENENNYLIKNYLTRKKYRENKEEIYSSDFGSFKQHFSDRKNKQKQLLANYQEKGLKEAFYEKEARRTDLYYYRKLTHYPGAHRYFAKEEPTLDKEFYKEIQKLPKDDEQYLAFDFYIPTLLKSLKLQQPVLDEDDDDYTDQLLSRIHTIENKTIQEHLLFNVASRNIKFGRNEEQLEEMKRQFLNTTTNDSLKNELLELAAKRNEIGKGKPAPDFKMVDTGKNTYQLSDFEGSLVVIDFWATWCKPCRKELPFVNELAARFEGEDITFLSVSLNKGDDAYEEWMEFQQEHDLSGELMLVLNNDHERVIDSYHIYGIPRYVLIDRNGDIISPNAPYPSEGLKLEKLLVEHL